MVGKIFGNLGFNDVHGGLAVGRRAKGCNDDCRVILEFRQPHFAADVTMLVHLYYPFYLKVLMKGMMAAICP
jgi:hypothetical protein